MLASAPFGRRTSRPIATRVVALITAILLALAVGVSANATTTTKPYTATWVSGAGLVANPPNELGVSGGSASVVLRLTNNAAPQTLGSANITPPSGYTLISGSVSVGTATKVGNTLQVRNLNLAPSASRDITINVSTPCAGSGPALAWGLIVKQANNFSGPPGNDFSRAAGTVAPSTSISGASACLLRFGNQPNTTRTGAIVTDGFDSTGSAIRVEIYDPGTGLTVDSDASVTLAPDANPAGGTLTGGVVDASAGVATFPALSVDTRGSYTLKASSPAASNTPVSNRFMVSDTIETCAGTGCSFTLPEGQNSYTTTPKKGASGATFVASLNLPGLRISCDFGPFDYPDARQPNAVWYVYDDGNALSVKTNRIVIDKAIVQATPENGASKYRVCFTAPEPFMDRTGALAPVDPWTDGPTTYFGETWYTGLLPDCANKNPVAPCVLSWTGDSSGNRVGTFLTPPGDPGYK